MAAELIFGEYEDPTTVVGTARSEWIIVSSWGGNGEFLSLARTNIAVVDQAAAPRGLQPTTTHLGILLARSAAGSPEETDYLLVRNRPADVPVGGVFHPSDGFVRVVRQAEGTRLTAHGRYAHCHGSAQGKVEVRDIPNPAPGFIEAKAWHFTAVQRPWIGEFPLAAADTATTRLSSAKSVTG